MHKFLSYKDFNDYVWELVQFIKHKKPLSPKYAQIAGSSKESVKKIPAWNRSQSDMKEFIFFTLGLENKEVI